MNNFDEEDLVNLIQSDVAAFLRGEGISDEESAPEPYVFASQEGANLVALDSNDAGDEKHDVRVYRNPVNGCPMIFDEEGKAKMLSGLQSSSNDTLGAHGMLPKERVVAHALAPSKGTGKSKLENSPGTASSKQEQDMLDALEVLIASNDGMLSGTNFEQLYRQDEAYKDMVKQVGGPKRLAEVHSDRFAWSNQGYPGGSIVLATSASQADEDDDQPWPDNTGRKIRKAEDEWTSSQRWPAEKITLANVHDRSLEEVLEELVRWDGGVLLASKVFLDVRQWWPNELERLKKEAREAGGLKNFVARYPDRYRWSTGGPGKEAIHAVKGAARNKAVDIVLELVKWSGGSMLASQILNELKGWDSEKANLVQAEVEAQGGMKRFISQHSGVLEWSLREGTGKETVMLATRDHSGRYNAHKDEDEATYHRGTAHSNHGSTVDTIVELIEWHGGKLLAAKVFGKLESWDKALAAQVKADVKHAGGFKRFVDRHPTLECFLDGAEGTETLRVRQKESYKDPANEWAWKHQ
eukprot:TRINITY_DN28122_c0_g2_i1.p1 TRINITY_DN28122_c0_g2~~TRINITY_DN28122_c0_g2_i1.p1  ORF type:complete len:524 (+),score=117.52 TRINITY_DN28122_c0_g2_i1:70-1641(+)